MKADITRSTYNKNKKYTRVNAQQGRAQVDADWNEQLDIQAHLDKTLLRDVVGKTGTPIEDPGFEITVDETTGFAIGKGRYYVDGIICENHSVDKLNAKEQEDLPDYSDLNLSPFKDNPIVPKTGGFYVVYLDVWQRHITFLEDPDLREVALGGADTTTRTKNVWQAKTLSVNAETAEAALAEFEAWKATAASTGKLRVRVRPALNLGRCEPTIESGYSGDENRLYRVEIHPNGKEESKALFKWSRENAAVAAKIMQIKKDPSSNNMFIEIENTGKDDRLRFGKGQWIEVTDDYHELWNISGLILQIEDVEENVLENRSILTVTVSKEVSVESLLYFNPAGYNNYLSKNPKVRRWNTPEDKWTTLGYTVDTTIGSNPVNNIVVTDYKELEDGVQIKFENGNYVAGDYWLVPARTLTRSLYWPTVKGKTGTKQEEAEALPSMMEHHYCPLALLHCSEDEKGNKTLKVVFDYREFFSAAANLLNFYYISGDGQEITPNNILAAKDLLEEVARGKIKEKGQVLQESKQKLERETLEDTFVLTGKDEAEPKAVNPILLCVGARIGNMPIDTESQNNFFVRFEIKDGTGVGRLARIEPEQNRPSATHVDVLIKDGIAKCAWFFIPEWTPKATDQVTPGKQQVSASLMLKSGDAEKPSQLVPIFFNATFAQPALRYASGDSQEIRLENQSSLVPYELKACLDVAGVPLPSSKMPLWRVKVKFSVAQGSGSLNPASAQASRVFDAGDVSEVGLVSCPWKLDKSTLHQQVKAELIDFNGKPFGSAQLYYNATLPIAFYYVSGDGQEITPKNVFLLPQGGEITNVEIAPELTPILLKVGAKTGSSLESPPNDQFTVLFEIMDEATSVGSLCKVEDSFKEQKQKVNSLEINLENGAAACLWAFTPPPEAHGTRVVSPGKQQVKATLKAKSEGQVAPTQLAPVFFNAVFAKPSLHYASGDGQEIKQETDDYTLPSELTVRVDAGNVPLPASMTTLWNVKVRYQLVESKQSDGKGTLDPSSEQPVAERTLNIEGQYGIVECPWRLGDKPVHQRAMADLVNAKGDLIGGQVWFNAKLPISFVYMAGDGREAVPNSEITLVVKALLGSKPLVGYKVQFSTDEKDGTVDPSTPIEIDEENGTANCKWKIKPNALNPTVDIPDPYNRLAQAVLLDEDGQPTNVPPIYFNAHLFVMPQVAAATSGIVKLEFKNKTENNGPLISNFIAHSLESVVPPAIILSLLPPETSDKPPNEATVESFEDFCLYNWANTSSGDEHGPFPRFKAVDVNLTSFRILMEKPYPRMDWVWYLRWWAIPAQPKKIQDATFENAFLSPITGFLDGNGQLIETVNVGKAFFAAVVDPNIATAAVNATLKIPAINYSKVISLKESSLHYIFLAVIMLNVKSIEVLYVDGTTETYTLPQNLKPGDITLDYSYKLRQGIAAGTVTARANLPSVPSEGQTVVIPGDIREKLPTYKPKPEFIPSYAVNPSIIEQNMNPGINQTITQQSVNENISQGIIDKNASQAVAEQKVTAENVAKNVSKTVTDQSVNRKVTKQTKKKVA